jgi:uncharacterized protein YcbK (DUF882 family)
LYPRLECSNDLVEEVINLSKREQMGVSRRTLLRLGGGGFASAAALITPALAAPALVGLKELNARTLSFDGYNTGEKLPRITYWVDGNYIPDALAAIDKALRDWRTGEIHPIEPKVIDLVYQIGRRLDTVCHFELISGYRSPKTNAMLRTFDPEVATNSLHMQGQAIDISLPGRPLRALYETALNMSVGGVGYYPNSNFIHVDVGRVRRWEG